MTRWLPLAAATVAIALLPAPAAAQEAAGDTVATVVVYGDDPCVPSVGEDTVICVRMDESERYRIPPDLRSSSDPANESWASKVKSFEAVGDFGPLSCSPVGAGGELGCNAQFIEAAYAERRNSSTVRAGELIAAAREERLATIDAEAAATQARVEELERQYMERVRQEQEGEAEPIETATGEPVEVDADDLPPLP